MMILRRFVEAPHEGILVEEAVYAAVDVNERDLRLRQIGPDCGLNVEPGYIGVLGIGGYRLGTMIKPDERFEHQYWVNGKLIKVYDIHIIEAKTGHDQLDTEFVWNSVEANNEP
jgi:hypothetical protein